MEPRSFDYGCEYAKSGRSGCKLCKCSIAEGSVRVARFVQV